jgi:cell division protease FtsH
MAALGYTIQRPEEDRFLMSRSELLNRITVLLGGRASESLNFPDISTGAADDLMRATDIARSMVVRFGMDNKLGQVTYEPEAQRFLNTNGMPEWRPRQYSEQTAALIDAEVRDLVETAFQRARAILAANLDTLRAAAQDLLKNETIAGEKLEELATKIPPWTDRV